MDIAFNILNTNRQIYLKMLEKYSLDQLNTIPDGFSNNIIWNIGHIVVIQQVLIYRLSGLPMYISKDLYNTYKKGSFPTGTTTKEEVNELKDLLFSLVDKTQKDYLSNRFNIFNPYQTQTGFKLSSLDESIIFNNYHEGLHLGIVMSISKFI